MAKPVWSDAQIIQQMDSGAHWSGTNLTYGFPTTASWFPYGERSGFSALNANQQAAATLVIKLWDDLIAPNLTFSANGAAANIKFSNTTTIGYAQTYFPGSSLASGAVWFNPTYDASSGTNNLVSPTAGQWGFSTYIHETGHAFGLDHPGDYNGGSPTYANNALFMQDSQQYTIMSYFDASNTGSDWVASDGKLHFAQTPMVEDIVVIQSMYGADTATRAGNTTYGFNSTANVWLFDFAQNLHPVLCIYDASGNDTLDLSGWTTPSTINLAPGSFSNCDLMTNNISIAKTAWIENAFGGGGNDTITGNILNNALDGGAGADTLIGGLGNDQYFVDNAGDVVTENSAEGHDTVYSSVTYALSANVEDLSLRDAGGAINGTGNSSDNAIFGNASNNTLTGLGGNDIIIGGLGADTMIGGIGNDQYVVDNVSDVVTENSAEGHDTVYSSVTYALSGNVEDLSLLDGAAPLTAPATVSDNVIVGNSSDNMLTGRGGNDIVIGGLGADTMIGGIGNDQLVVDNVGDVVNENFGEGTDTIWSSVSYTAPANVETLVLYDTGGANDATGNSLDNALVGNSSANTLTGLGGNDLIVGGTGTDTMLGGVGNDTYDVDNVGDVVTELANEGIDAVFTAVSYTLGANIENLVMQAVAGAINGTGNNSNNAIIGNASNNTIDGGAGIDTLIGSGGNDTFVFKAVEANGDTVTDFDGQGVALGDQFQFVGYGTAAQGATFTNVDATHWSINSFDNSIRVIIALGNGQTVHASDYIFI